MSSLSRFPSALRAHPGSAAEYTDASFLCDRLRSEASDPRPRVDELISILRRLLSTPISVDFLQSTKIGLLVNSLRKEFPKEKELINLAKELINRWKLLVQQKNAAEAGQSPEAISQSHSQSHPETQQRADSLNTTHNPPSALSGTKEPVKSSAQKPSPVAAASAAVTVKPAVKSAEKSAPAKQAVSSKPAANASDSKKLAPILKAPVSDSKSKPAVPIKSAQTPSKPGQPAAKPMPPASKASSSLPIKPSPAQSKPTPSSTPSRPLSSDVSRKRVLSGDVETSTAKKAALTKQQVDALFEEEEVLETSETMQQEHQQPITYYNPNAHLFEYEIRDTSAPLDGSASSADSSSSSSAPSGPVHLCSLQQMCIEYIQFHLTQFPHFEALPSKLIPILFSKASIAQLKTIEANNPHLVPDTDVLWRALAMRKFPDFNGDMPKGMTSWRAVFQSLEAEKQARLHEVGERLKAKQAASAVHREANSVKPIDAKTAVIALAKAPKTGISIPKLPGAGKLAAIRSDSAKINKSVWNAKPF